MSKNKYLLEFSDMSTINKRNVFSANWYTPEFLEDRKAIEKRMADWCSERISVQQQFPHWQFSTKTIQIKVTPYTGEFHEVAVGIFLLNETDRIAFKLAFQL